MASEPVENAPPHFTWKRQSKTIISSATLPSEFPSPRDLHMASDYWKPLPDGPLGP